MNGHCTHRNVCASNFACALSCSPTMLSIQLVYRDFMNTSCHVISSHDVFEDNNDTDVGGGDATLVNLKEEEVLPLHCCE